VQSRSPSLHLLLPPQAIDTYVHMHASAISVVVVILVGRSGSLLVQLLTLSACRSTAYSLQPTALRVAYVGIHARLTRTGGGTILRRKGT
jgi:hypothetical protein